MKKPNFALQKFIAAFLLFNFFSTNLIAQLSIHAVNALRRIHIDENPGDKPDIILKAAKNEWESFQVVVHASSQQLTNVNFTVSDFRKNNNSTISSSHITLYREHFVHVSKPTPTYGGLTYTNKSLGAGYYADALIPFNDPVTNKPLKGAEIDAVPTKIDVNNNAIFWADIHVPPGADAGEYTATYKVTSSQGSKSGNITLKIWDFALPEQPCMYSSFGFYTSYNKHNIIQLLQNKLMPVNIDPSDQNELINKYGLNTTSLGFWSGADITTCKMDAPPSVHTIKSSVQQYDTSLLIYNYTADEISNCAGLHDDVIRWSRHLHKGGSNNLIVMIPDTTLFDDGLGNNRSAVDIWSELPLQLLQHRNVTGKAIKANQQVWSYTALFQTEGNVPVWEIDFTPMNFRIYGLINQSRNLTGLLYWCVDYGIYKKKDVWKDGYSYSNGDYNFPGEGNLFYPGDKIGTSTFAQSMRLKWIRDGVEDYEYVEILKKCGYEKEAKQTIKTVAADWNNWTKNIQDLYDVREQLAGLILEKTCSENKQPLIAVK